MRYLILILAVWLSLSAADAGQSAADRLAAIEARLGGHLGVAALDTASQRHIEYRADERFPMCSTFKLLATAAVLRRVDDKQERLDRFVRYGAADILEYAPVAKEHLKDGGMTLAALCEAAITQSDNTAANLLLDTIGGPAGLTDFARGLGDSVTRLDRKEPELNVVTEGDERDTTSPKAMLEDVRLLLMENVLLPSSRQQLEKWLRENQTGTDLIRAGVPAGWVVGDKTGRGANGATNDIAIIRPPGRGPILLAIYYVGSPAPAGERATAMAEAARIVIESW